MENKNIFFKEEEMDLLYKYIKENRIYDSEENSSENEEQFEEEKEDINEFKDVDLNNLLLIKNEEKMIDYTSDYVLQSLSAHWKYILEVITMKKELADHMAKVLFWKSENKIVGVGKKFFILNNGCWKKIDRDTGEIYINRLKSTLITESLYMLTSLQDKYPNNSKLWYETEKIKDKLKTNYQKFIKNYTLKSFIDLIITENFNISRSTENPIGEIFLNETFEFTKDGKFYGVTSKKLYELREEWIKRNPLTKIKSYKENEIGIFGKMVKEHKTWGTETAKITKHLGIKIKKE